ncbi:DUF945 family protein [Marinobacter zhanjiangensis]|uniref:DUF945 domain-containing protein n=1 Tax=Marinobacter zhanjiangensis TaxID=578215 RepID=A0ABQ3AK02_9GAMM|nr:DUF945 family protein [Marinobacter zhanjiangensis]GGY58393.1 hypothetical protein GCM10007071_00600 [Marinobacter zhanjiangensis]
MKKAWIIAGGVVVVAAVAAPWAVGMLTEQHWQSATGEFNESQPFFVIETDQYERGYLGSTASGQVYVVDPDTGERHPMGWTGDVSHGITSSTILFNFDLPDDEVFDRIFPDDKPTVKVTTSAWGSSLVELDVPAIDYTDEASGETVNVSQGFATLEVSSDGEQLDFITRWPGLVLRTAEARVSLENLNMEQQSTLLTGSLWTGDGSVTMDKLSVAVQGEPEVVLEGLEMNSSSTPVKDDKAVSATVTTTLDKVVHGGQSYGPHSLDVQLQEMDVAAWNEMLEAIETVQQLSASAGDDPQQAYEQQMQATMAVSGSIEKLMARGMTAITDLNITSPEGPVTGYLRVSHPEQPDEDRVPLMLIAQTIEGEMSVKIPVALGEQYPELGEQLMPMVMQGALVEEGDFYVMDASLNNMTVNLNGQEMPIPMPGMGGGSSMLQ